MEHAVPITADSVTAIGMLIVTSLLLLVGAWGLLQTANKNTKDSLKSVQDFVTTEIDKLATSLTHHINENQRLLDINYKKLHKRISKSTKDTADVYVPTKIHDAQLEVLREGYKKDLEQLQKAIQEMNRTIYTFITTVQNGTNHIKSPKKGD